MLTVAVEDVEGVDDHAASRGAAWRCRLECCRWRKLIAAELCCGNVHGLGTVDE